MDNEVSTSIKVLNQLKAPGGIAQITRARKEHTCKACSSPINKGELYYCIYIGGGGLGNLKFPIRSHINCMEAGNG